MKYFVSFIYTTLCLFVITGSLAAADPGALLNSPQAQQLLQQLPPAQQAQIQAQAEAEAEAHEAPLVTGVSLEKAGANVQNEKQATQNKSSLEKLYETRVLGNRQLVQLSANEAPFFRQILPDKIPDMQYSQFGYDIFSQGRPLVPATMPVHDGYILGTGDALTVYLWGKLEERLELVLDSSGSVLLPKSGPLQLAGVSFRNAGKMIQQELSKNFVNFDIQVVFKQRRNIQVYLLGNAASPGAFQVPAGTRLTGLLYLAQGPLKEGSLRKVQVLRNNRVLRTVDLYDYLLNGDRRHDVVLENEDTVLIPPVGDSVLIGGTITRPGIYELSSHDSVSDVVGFAAGLTWDHYYKRVQIYRVQSGEFQRVEDVVVQTAAELSEKTKHLKLKNGDVLLFHPMRKELRNVVTVAGHVQRPGHYQWGPELTLSTLMNKAGGMLPRPISRVDIYRFVSDESTRLISLDYSMPEDQAVKLQEWDVVQVYSETALMAPEYVTIQGSVKDPGKYPLMADMRLQDLLFMAKLDTILRAPEIDIVRFQKSGEVVFLSATLDANGMVTPNMPLQSADEIRVKTLRNPKIKVKIMGEVAFPGEFVLTEKSRITDVLKRVGGLTSEAYLIGTVFTRAKLAENTSAGQDKVIKDEQKRLMYDQLQMGAFSETDKKINETVLTARVAYIQQLQTLGVQNRGRMVINMSGVVAEGPGSVWDLFLEDGDTILIQKRPDYVQLWGGLESPATYQYMPDWKWGDYLAKAGGLSRYADVENIKVFHVDGTVSKLGDRLQPGDIVYVPEKIEVPFNWMFFMRSTADVLKIVADSVFSFLVIKGLATGF